MRKYNNSSTSSVVEYHTFCDDASSNGINMCILNDSIATGSNIRYRLKVTQPASLNKFAKEAKSLEQTAEPVLSCKSSPISSEAKRQDIEEICSDHINQKEFVNVNADVYGGSEILESYPCVCSCSKSKSCYNNYYYKQNNSPTRICSFNIFSMNKPSIVWPISSVLLLLFWTMANVCCPAESQLAFKSRRLR